MSGCCGCSAQHFWLPNWNGLSAVPCVPSDKMRHTWERQGRMALGTSFQSICCSLIDNLLYHSRTEYTSDPGLVIVCPCFICARARGDNRKQHFARITAWLEGWRLPIIFHQTKNPPLQIFQNLSVLNPKVHTSLAPHLASSPSRSWPHAGASASAGVWHPRMPKRCSSGHSDAAAGPCCCRCAPGPAATCASPRPRSRWSPELGWENGMLMLGEVSLSQRIHKPPLSS